MAYSNAIYYIDLYNGSDTARTALTGVIASNNGSGGVRMTKTAHGLVTGAVVVASLFTTYLNGSWKITKIDDDNFDLDTAVWATTADANGTITPNGGSSWADAWKTIYLGASAARIQPGDVIRISKTPDPVQLCNATWTDGGNEVVLSQSYTTNICNGEDVWSSVPGSDCTPSLDTNSYIHGTKSIKLAFDSVVQTGIKQAYYTTELLDLSSYTQISLRFASPVAMVNGALRIALCSDTLGNTPVDWFDIPLMSSMWSGSITFIPLVLNKVGGGNLGNAIQSIALYTGAIVTGVASRIFNIDNIVACNSTFNHLTLLTKSALAQPTVNDCPGTFAILYIDGVNIGFDRIGRPVSQGRATFKGTTETVMTYTRDAFLDWNIQLIQDSGTANAYIEYQGGFNTITNEQDGQTIYDGFAYDKAGISVANRNYIKLNWLGIVRSNYALYTQSSTRIYYDNIGVIASCNQIYLYSLYNSYIENLWSVVNCSQGVTISMGLNNLLNNVYYHHSIFLTYSASYDNTINYIKYTEQFQCYTSVKTRVKHIEEAIMISFVNSARWNVIDRVSKVNTITTGGDAHDNYVNGIDDNVAVHTVNFSSQDKAATMYVDGARMNGELPNQLQNDLCYLYSHNEDNVEGKNAVYSQGVKAAWQTTVKHLTDIGAWEYSFDVRVTNRIKPFEMKIGEVACVANQVVTIAIWFKAEDTAIIGQLRVPTAYNLGITTDIVQLSEITTDWQQITVQVTINKNGVFELYFDLFPISYTLTSHAYLGSISITQ